MNYITFRQSIGACLGHVFFEYHIVWILAKIYNCTYCHSKLLNHCKDHDLFFDNSIELEDIIMKTSKKIVTINNIEELLNQINDANVIKYIDFEMGRGEFLYNFVKNNEEFDKYFQEFNNFCMTIAEKFYIPSNNKIVNVHIRRPNRIIEPARGTNPTWDNKLGSKLYEPLSRYIEILDKIYEKNKNITINIFSLGDPAEFDIFKKYKNVNFYINYDLKESIKKMICFDIFIKGRSGLSDMVATFGNNSQRLIIGDRQWAFYDKSLRNLTYDVNTIDIL